MMKELSKTGYSLAVIQAIALRMAFACWLLFTTFPILAQEHSVSLHLNHVSLLEAINEIKRQSNLNLMYSDEDVLSAKFDTKRYFYPIPYSEVIKNGNMIQNPNW